MVEDALIETMDLYIREGHENEVQLASLCKDLIQLTGHLPIVREYINMKAARALDPEVKAWP